MNGLAKWRNRIVQPVTTGFTFERKTFPSI